MSTRRTSSNGGFPPNLSAVSPYHGTFSILQIFIHYGRKLFHCLSEKEKTNPIKHPRQLLVFHVAAWKKGGNTETFHTIITLKFQVLVLHNQKTQGSEGAVG